MSKPKKIFGTDGVRGIANVEPVTAETALKLGRAAGHVFKNLESQPRSHGRHQIVIGKDTRLSGYMLENALSSGVLSMGVDVLFIGPLPTPGVAYVTRSLRADAGLVITASHNPYADNGIKFFRADGYKLDDKIEFEIENLVFSGAIEHIRPTAEEIGKAVRIDDALGRYIEYAKASFPRGKTLEGMRVVVDAANGAAYKSTPCVLRELGAEVIESGNQPDGKNINQDCGSMHPQHFCQRVREFRADLGIAHDGDADRVQLCDEHGALIDGDDIMAIAALDMLAQGTLAGKTLVATVMSNAGLDVAIAAGGGRMIRTDVGDARCWTRFPQLVTNIVVREKKPFAELEGMSKLLADAEAEVQAQGGRVLLRYSGTEPKARLLLEGRDKGVLEKWSKAISEALRRQLGA